MSFYNDLRKPYTPPKMQQQPKPLISIENEWQIAKNIVSRFKQECLEARKKVTISKVHTIPGLPPMSTTIISQPQTTTKVAEIGMWLSATPKALVILVLLSTLAGLIMTRQRLQDLNLPML